MTDTAKDRPDETTMQEEDRPWEDRPDNGSRRRNRNGAMDRDALSREANREGGAGEMEDKDADEDDDDQEEDDQEDDEEMEEPADREIGR